MRKVMYLVNVPCERNFWTESYKLATSGDNKILKVQLVPVDTLTDEQRTAREEYRKKIWEKFHKKPQT